MIKSKVLFLEYVLLLLALFFIASLVVYDGELISGFTKIMTSTGIIFSDYISIGGIKATLLNVTLVTALNLLIIKYFDIKVSGAIFAAVFIVMGFSFFGKNLINILPIYFGTYLYSKSEGKQLKSYFVFAMFATGLAPIVSFGFDKGPLFIIIGIVLGILYGFIIPTFSAHVIRFHGGYTLYNVGFAGGIIAILVYSVMELFDIKHNVSIEYSIQYSNLLYLLLLSISILYLVASFTVPKTNKKYRKLLSMSGRAVTDFTMIIGHKMTYLNIALLGFILVIPMYFFNIEMTGIIFGAAMTVIGFGTFGKHPKNIFPVMLGVILAGIFFKNEVSHGTVIVALFATSLAPIAGDFGFVAGLIAGVFHYSIVSRSAMWQGGLNLYNNGFASGFVAAIISSVLDTVEFRKIFGGHTNETS